ncbi:MAG: hypothetical protein IJX20_02495, partial [Alphaproteobacteria bacterium]|nr:hypothetical protein [Alphaproteobacteria bacterium]
MKKYHVLMLVISLCLYSQITEAKTTFLPDWMGDKIHAQRMDFDGNINYDEPMCEEAGIYHRAPSCPNPKIFDEFCPYDDDWISECYCPSIFAHTCSYPYRGDVRRTDGRTGYANCDDKWVACCNGSCPGNTSLSDPGGCGGSTTNDCGDTCYYPYEPCCVPLADETGCQYGTETCSDGCDGSRICCKACTPLSDESNCKYGTTSCSDGCGGTRECCSSCSPMASVDASTCQYGTTSCPDGCGGSRTCCAECTPTASVDAATCPYGTEDCDDGCGGTRKCCKGCTPLTKETGCSYGTKNCDDGCGGTRQCCKTCADNGGTTTCSGESSADKCANGHSGTCKDCKGNTKYICNATPSCVKGGSAACSGKSKKSECTYGSSSTCKTCDGTTLHICDSCSDTCDNGTTSSSCTSPKTATKSGKTECGTQCYTCSCPSDYKYACSGTGYKSGSGTACDSKYKSCNCSDGYEWKDGACKKKETSCGDNEELKNGVCVCIKDYVKVSGVCKNNTCSTNNGQNATCPDGSKANKAYTNSAGNPCYHCSTTPTPKPSSTCTYTYTESSCTSSCKNVGTEKCTKNGTTYYKSCGSSKCSSGQQCCSGTCKTFKGCSASSSSYVTYTDGPYDPPYYCHSR